MYRSLTTRKQHLRRMKIQRSASVGLPKSSITTHESIQCHWDFQQLRFQSSFKSSHNSRHSADPRSPWWWMAAAVGSYVLLEVCEYGTPNQFYTKTTMAEGKRPMDREEEENDRTPWYRRYSTQVVDMIRHPTRQNFVSRKEEELDNTTMFEGQCLQRQVHKPRLPYPAWDYNWDGKMLNHWSTLEALSTPEGLRRSSCTGTTRHIILVRHGQYHEPPLDDRKRVLTALGRRQAYLTGKRVAHLVDHLGEDKINAIHTSDMLRAKQTAYIMAKSLPDSIAIQSPDPDLNEALPAPMIPSRPDIPDAEEEIDLQHERMDRVFRKYFYRADPPKVLKDALEEYDEQLQQHRLEQEPEVISAPPEPQYNISASGTISMLVPDATPPPFLPSEQSSEKESKSTQLPPLKLPPLPKPNHEFDILVCHGNIIRYFVCRALQLPPEAWLRMSVFNCSITYIMIKPNGYVSVRMIGDIGHLGYKETTFSGAHGLEWS